MLKLMAPAEIEGVLAHELGHIKNRDILIGTVAATMAGAVMMLASMARWSAIFGGGRGNDEEGGMGGLGLIVMSLLAPVGAMIIQMAISRSREYLADATGAAIAGRPDGLAAALEKLGAYSRKLPMQANPTTAHMFIVNPLAGGSLMRLFSTHPPLEQRIARLRGRPSPGSRRGAENGKARAKAPRRKCAKTGPGKRRRLALRAGGRRTTHFLNHRRQNTGSGFSPRRSGVPVGPRKTSPGVA